MHQCTLNGSPLNFAVLCSRICIHKNTPNYKCKSLKLYQLRKLCICIRVFSFLVKRPHDVDVFGCISVCRFQLFVHFTSVQVHADFCIRILLYCNMMCTRVNFFFQFSLLLVQGFWGYTQLRFRWNIFV